eukprot:8818552-Pyramimonas_sp.AAC.1
MHSLYVEAVHNAHDTFAPNREPIRDHPHASLVLLTNARGCDSDDPAILRHPDGGIAQPPSGGWGCPGCADN